MQRLPDEFDDLLDNRQEFDQEAFNRIVRAFHYRNANAFPNFMTEVRGDIYLYGLHE